MGRYPEQIIHEFEPIIKVKNWKKEVQYRIQIVKRISLEGMTRYLLDLREYKIDEKASRYFENGITLNIEGIRHLRSCLDQAERIIREKGKEEYGPGRGVRSPGIRDNSQEG